MPHNKTITNTLIAGANILPQQLEALRKWIADLQFEQYESAEYILASTQKRPHNRLYDFRLPMTEHRVVMKVVHINKQYNWMRRLHALLKHYLRRDANYKAFSSCCRAYRRKLATPMPIAYWQKRDGIAEVKSYFLYRYIENGVPWLEVSEKLKSAEDSEAKLHEDLLKKKIIDAVKSLHSAGIRHGDMVAHNILICHPHIQPNTDYTQAKVCFIDYDRSSIARITQPAFLKQCFDLRDLRKIYINDACPHDLLSIYLADNYQRCWKAVLAFWQLGSKRKK